MSEVDVSQVLDDDVEALVAGEVHQLFLVRFVVVVVNLIESKQLLNNNLFCRSCSTNQCFS